MPAVPAFDVDGLILAGGRGSRLGGVDKGWVDYRGQPLIRHAIGRLQPQVKTLFVSANRNLDRYLALGAMPVTDDPKHGDFAGPLAGVLAGLRSAHAPWLAVVPCDAPDAPADFVVRLRAALAPDVGAAVASVGGRMEPLFCVVRCDLAPTLQAFLDGGGRKVAAWLDAIDAVAVHFADAQAFANVNTPADLPPAR